jgi:hypothetical protein
MNDNKFPQMDWQQVALNGGPPCFAQLDDEEGWFCGRAERWEGHDGEHEFVSFQQYVTKVIADEREAKWQRIESAPRTVEWQGDGHGYGPYILAWPVFGTVARVRWWQCKAGSHGWIEDGGNAVSPTIWQSLPAPPAISTGEEGS